MAKKRKTTARRHAKSAKVSKGPAKKRAIKKTVRAKRSAIRKKKAVARKVKGAQREAEVMALEKVGEVTHYFPQVKAAAVLVAKDGLKLGDKIHIKGHTTDFKEKITSMQLDRVPIESAKKGQEIGLLVKSRARIGDVVYRI